MDKLRRGKLGPNELGPSQFGGALRADLQSEKAERRFGTGWISGVLALACALAGLITVLCIRYPNLLTTPMLREELDIGLVRLGLHIVLILGFMLAVLNLALRR